MHSLYVFVCCRIFVAASPASNEKKSTRKMRRERKKLLKKKSTDGLDNLMSELPFALTSPTTWKELGCMYED